MIDLSNKTPCWDIFHKVGAEQRVEIVDRVQNKINDAEKLEQPSLHHKLMAEEQPKTNRIDLSDWDYWVLKELFWADLEYCDYCEERLPSLLMFNPTDADEDDSPEEKAMEALGIEYGCCSACIIEEKNEVTCANCGTRQSFHKYGIVKECKRYIDGEYVVFDEHDWKTFEDRQAVKQ